jgi:hypothetical protein
MSISLTKILDADEILDWQGVPFIFDDHKAYADRGTNGIENLSNMVKTVMDLPNPIKETVDNGIVAILNPITRIDISSDCDSLKSIIPQARTYIASASSKQDWKPGNDLIKAYNNFCGIIEPNPWQLFPADVNRANILHGIIDALSYELEGKNSYTGDLQPVNDKLIQNRIFTAKVYLNKLPSNSDTNNMRSIIQYVEDNFKKIESAEIGQYIDANMEKLITPRRWWDI